MEVKMADVDRRIIDRAVVYIILYVMIVVLSMISYSLDFSQNSFTEKQVSILLGNISVDFLCLFLIYPIMEKSRRAYKVAAALAILYLLGYIFEFSLSSVTSILLLILSVIVVYILLSQPMRGWCLPVISEKQCVK